MRLEETLEFEKDAPKTRAFGVRTKDGVLIKVWIPKDMIGKDVKELPVELEIPSSKKSKKDKGKSKKRKQRDEEDEEDLDEDDEDEEDEEE